MGIGANSWYAISAYTNGGYDLTTDDLFTSEYCNYDLYRYDEATATWENYKNSHFTSLEPGRGYIYRRDSYMSFDFGTANEGNFTSEYALSNTSTCPDNNNLKGFNLIGNPYQHSIYKGEDFDEDGSLDVGYYSLNRDGSWLAHLDDDPIEVGQGVLVRVSDEVSSEVSLSFTDNAVAPAVPDEKGSRVNGLQFTATGGGHEDVAYAIFNSQSSTSKSDGLPKFSHLNAEAPSLSIVQDGSDYAIAMIDGNVQSFPLKFHATREGEYTIGVGMTGDKAYVGELEYLHLLDRLTGADIDLQSQPTYTFTHTLNQGASPRFLVKLSPDSESDNGIFAYQNGDRIVVEGAGTLQVYDVMGRQLFTHEINSQFSILNSQFPSTGVYIFRLGEKSQKLVIK